MSDYVKQEWIDNETLINAERMNHIEDGIAAAGGEAPIEHITVNKVEQPIVDKTVDLDIDKAYVEETTLIIGDDAGGGGGTIERIKVNGTALAIENSTVDISVPTKVSELTNDAKFITDAALEDYAKSSDVETVKETADTALATANGVADTAITGITVNGTAATVNDHVAEITVSGESAIECIQVNGIDQTIKDKTVNISVPTKTSELTNDSGYITDSDMEVVKKTADTALTTAEAAQNAIPTKVSELENDAKYATESAIPTKVSQLENDSGYATAPTVDGEMLVYGG